MLQSLDVNTAFKAMRFCCINRINKLIKAAFSFSFLLKKMKHFTQFLTHNVNQPGKKPGNPLGIGECLWDNRGNYSELCMGGSRRQLIPQRSTWIHGRFQILAEKLRKSSPLGDTSHFPGSRLSNAGGRLYLPG